MGVCTALAWGGNPRWLASGHGFRAGAWSPESLLAAGVLAEHVLDSSIRIWDLETGAVARMLVGHSADVVGIAISADDMRLASTDERATTRVWDLTSGDCIEILEAVTDPTAIAAGAGRHPWLATAKGYEFSIRGAAGRAMAVRLPAAAKRLAAAPSGRSWALADGRHLDVFVVENAG